MFLSRFFSSSKRFDWILFIPALLLVCFGLAAIYSVDLGKEGINFLDLKKQIVALAIGLVAFFSVSFIDYKAWKNYRYFLYIFILLLLAGVLIFGTSIRGTKGWFVLAGFNFQPVELAKFGLIVFLAYFFSQKGREMDLFRNIVLSGLGPAIACVLVILQPDFGSALLLFSIWLGMLIMAKIKWTHLLLIFLLFITAFVGAWFFAFQPYQKDRMMTFINPGADPLGRGYNITQSTIAVGSGNLFGRGLGFGSQSQLKFLPESHTDFIFSVIGEELGFAGVSLVLFFWGFIFYRLIRAARLVKDDFGLFLLIGIIVSFFVQIMLNIGMNIGVAPVAGVSLPLISYGGSSLIVSLLLIGVAESVIAKNR